MFKAFHPLGQEVENAAIELAEWDGELKEIPGGMSTQKTQNCQKASGSFDKCCDGLHRDDEWILAAT